MDDRVEDDITALSSARGRLINARLSSGDPIKITGVETLHADGGWRPWNLLALGVRHVLSVVPGDLGWRLCGS